MCLATGYVSFSECGECIQNCDGGVGMYVYGWVWCADSKKNMDGAREIDPRCGGILILILRVLGAREQRGLAYGYSDGGWRTVVG